jgi:hypothetical protein
VLRVNAATPIICQNDATRLQRCGFLAFAIAVFAFVFDYLDCAKAHLLSGVDELADTFKNRA